MFLRTLEFELSNNPFVSWYTCCGTTATIRQDVLIFWKPGNFMVEMQGVKR